MKKLFLFGLIILLVIGSWLVFLNLQRTKNPAFHQAVTESSLPEKQMTTETQASLFLVPQNSQLVVDQNLSLEIRLTGQNLSLSGIALHLSYPFDKIPPLQPQSTKIQPNSDWQQQGWIYPINKVWVDWQNKTVNLELAAVNPTLTGFQLNGEDILGTIELTAEAAIENLILAFDPQQTKLTTKDNQKVKLNFLTGIYQIK